MRRVLIVHASRHGGTSGIADRIGEVLRSEGIDAVVAPAAEMPDPQAFDACLIGSGVYMGSWVKDGTEYLERYVTTLATRPVWLFSSGPLPGSTKRRRIPSRIPSRMPSARAKDRGAVAGRRSRSCRPRSTRASTTSSAARSTPPTPRSRSPSGLSG